MVTRFRIFRVHKGNPRKSAGAVQELFGNCRLRPLSNKTKAEKEYVSERLGLTGNQAGKRWRGAQYDNLEIGGWRTVHSAWPAPVWSRHVIVPLAQQPGHGRSQLVRRLRYRHRLPWSGYYLVCAAAVASFLTRQFMSKLI